MWNRPRCAKGRKIVAPDHLSEPAPPDPTGLSTNELEPVEQTQTPTGLKTSERPKEPRTPGQASTQNKAPSQRKRHLMTPPPEAEEKEQSHHPPTAFHQNPADRSCLLERINQDDRAPRQETTETL
ncbi:hypothetical protein NDU88_007340 [Pleurodeles waltl]|uniref:Uncharacterized protein n=1 Tax=Pleurodeles waltl TaxID=8319 RepID=A0AAV7VPG5_PLEWA|nr:hypothetical protein NDU88_007340 [Pleurodeles waltl]